MSQKYLGGYLADTTSFTTAASGDPQFNYVTALLHGDGTNAAQNNTFLDSSTNNFTITRNGNTTQGTFSPYGSLWSNYFNGSSAYLNWTGANCNGGTWTLEAWVCPTANGGGSYGGRGIICCGDVYLNMGFDSANKITLRWYTGSAGYSISSTTVLTLNTWYHVAVTFQSGTAAKVFVNGVLETSTTSNVTIGSATDWYIGREGAQASYFPGYISNARVSSSILYSATFTPSTTPLTVGATTNTLTCQSNRFIDNSTNAYVLTITAATIQRFSPFNTSTAYSTSVIGGSMYTSGATGNYLSSTLNSSGLSLTGNMTIQGWMYVTTYTNEFVFAVGTGSYRICLQLYNNLIYVAYGDVYTSKNTTQTQSTYLLNSWHHFAVVRNGNDVRLYIDGIDQGSYGTIATNPTNYDLYVADGAAAAVPFYGYLSNIVFTQSAVYTAAFIPPTAPVSTGTVLLNFTNGGIYDNAAMNNLETVGNAQISTSVYKYGTGSLYFDGSGDQLSRASSSLYSFGTGDFTVEMWVNTSSTANMCLIDTRPTGAAEPWAIYTTATTSYPYFYDGSSRTSSIALTLNTWVHVAVCRASGTLRIFVNGVQGYSAANTTNLTSGAVQIGGAFSGAYLTGYIDDLRITNGYARYTTTFTPPTAAFPNYYTPTVTTSIVPTSTAAPGIWTMEQQGYYKAQSLWPTPPPPTPTVDYIVVAGGGGGGRYTSGGGCGGGGAGGFRTASSFSVSSGSALTVTVGAGGAAATNGAGSTGSNSVFSTITSNGGGGGGSRDTANPGNGGSGGGAAANSSGFTKSGGTGNTPSTSPSQGNNGGNDPGPDAAPYLAAGGGGASAVGANRGTGTGGAGTASSYSGSSVTYAGGGAGGSYSGTSAVSGGAGGGGNGGYDITSATSGTANRGGGGGGSGNGGSSAAGSGGSGVVVIRYANTYPDASATTGSPTYANTGGYKIYTFTSSGTITF